jgi:hypothetical protein
MTARPADVLLLLSIITEQPVAGNYTQLNSWNGQSEIHLNQRNANSMAWRLAWEASRCLAIQKFSSSYGIRRFIAVFTRTRHCLQSEEFSSHPLGTLLWDPSKPYIKTPKRSHNFPSSSVTTILCAVRISPTHTTRPASIILIDFSCWTMSKAYEWRSV